MKWDEIDLSNEVDKVSEKIRNFEDVDLPFIGLEHIEKDTLKLSGIGNVSEISSDKTVFQPEDILFGTLRPYFRKVYQPKFDGVCSTDITVLRSKQDSKVNQKFLFYFIANQSFIDYASSFAKDQRPRVNWKDVVKKKFLFPTLPTQRKIASILSAYDDLIENNLKRIKLLEEKAFVCYKLIVNNEKLKAFTIEELANVVMGQSPTSDTYTNEKEDYLPFHQGVTNFSNYFVEHKIYCKAPIKIAEEGDILFSVRAPVGRINFTSDEICIGRGLCAFRSKKGFQNYFYQQLKEFFFIEDVIGNGAIFNAVTKAELMKVKLKTPSDKIQQEFEEEAQQMYNLILNLTKQNTKLREARDILLPRLMSGEVEV